MNRGRIRTPVAFGQMLQQSLPLLRARLKIPIDIFHHDHGGIEDDAEVDRTERQKVGVLALQDQEDNGKEQRERDVRTDDDGAAEIAQEYPLNEEDQETAKNQVVQNRTRGDPDQRATIVVGNDLNSWRQTSVGVELFDLGLNAWNDIVGVLGPTHDHDRGGDVVVVIPARYSKPRHETHGNAGHVLDLDRQAIRLSEDDVLDVLNLVTLGNVFGAAVVDQADATDVDRLLPDRDLAATDIDVGVAERGDQLWDCDVVGLKLLQVGIDVELLRRPTPGIDLHHTGDCQHTTGDDVILNRAQVGQSEMRRSDQLVAVDFADEARLLNGRDLAAWQIDILLQADRGLRQREIEVDAIPEGDADEGQSVKRCRADVDDAGRRIKPDLHRDGIVFLHLLGR